MSDIVKVVTAVMHGIEDIVHVAENKIGITTKDALLVIQRIANTVRAGALGHISPESVEQELAKIKASLSSNDAAIDQAIDEKFK